MAKKESRAARAGLKLIRLLHSLKQTRPARRPLTTELSLGDRTVLIAHNPLPPSVPRGR